MEQQALLSERDEPDERERRVVLGGLGPPKIGPQRMSKVVQKVKLLPEHEREREREREYEQDEEGLRRRDRKRLPRVSAYCTASSYKMKEFTRYLSSKQRDPRIFDECIYAVYKHEDEQEVTVENGVRIGIGQEHEVFIFEYGVCVLWGFSIQDEQRFLQEISRFELEKLAGQDVQIEEFNYYITKEYRPRIYNDLIALRDNDYMIKLSLSHAIAQSVKISLFEDLVDHTIKTTKDIPVGIALTGKVRMSRRKIMMQIGDLFILRININLHGSIIDSPELMWSQPELEPLYQAARSYLEISQRVSLLNSRLEVISDLLQMLKEQLGHVHDEYLEVVVIFLIAAEIFVAFINIIVDFVAR
ncbi:hypothetical protein V1512DRAFT_287458 [Lipomyces arxii]|uniref:uncharacterized protein n=1 Tax=Lipomyces arxii TaxID=56418 RepID=UPI0034CE5365